MKEEKRSTKRQIRKAKVPEIVSIPQKNTCKKRNTRSEFDKTDLHRKIPHGMKSRSRSVTVRKPCSIAEKAVSTESVKTASRRRGILTEKRSFRSAVSFLPDQNPKRTVPLFPPAVG